MPACVSGSARAVIASAVGALVVGGLGCASTPTLQIKVVDAAVAPPANVALHLKVTRPDGEPVTLEATDFKVLEDGKPIPAKKLKRALLPTTAVVERYLLIAVDLSGPIVDSEYLSTLHDAIGNLVERVGRDTHLGVQVFDGDGLKPFVNFGDSDQKAGLAGVRRFRPHNRTVDLWGSYLAALDALDEAASHATAPEHTAQLIFVTDRRDKAGKHTLDQAKEKLQASKASSFVIGLGDAIDQTELRQLGRPDAFFADKFKDLRKPLEQVADRVEATQGEDLVFAYCSLQKPGKEGKKKTSHTVELRVETKEVHGAVEHEFTSAAFERASCDPRQKPDFSAKAAEAPADGADAEEEARPKPRRAKKKPKPDEETGE